MTLPGRAQLNVADFLGPQLKPDERVDAVLNGSLSGESWPLIIAVCVAAALIGGFLAGFFAIGPARTVVAAGVAALLTAAVQFRFFVRSHATALTNQRLLLIQRSPRTGRLGAIEGTYPRSSVRLIGYRPGPLFGSLKIGLSGESDLALSFLTSGRKGAGQIAAALESQAAT
jgi:hypothetical protein